MNPRDNLPPAARKLTHCLACGSSALSNYLDLGQQPLANSFVADAALLPRYPLGLNRCTQCFHSQLTHAINPDLLFKHYLYISGTTKTLEDYFSWLATDITRRHGERLSLLDIASNDGSFLFECQKLGHQVLGVDPAENLRVLSAEKGIETRVAYWNQELASQITPVDVMVAMNVLAHVPDPLGFLQACVLALKPGGTLYIQTSQANIFSNCEFDTVYHEHHSFFTIRSMRLLAGRAGLRMADVRVVPIHGGSYLFALQREEDCLDGSAELESQELAAGLYDVSTYDRFQERAEKIAAEVREVFADLSRQGYRIAAYGAAAKGNTFVNFCQLSLDFMVDDNPMKCGLRSPGMNTPVVPASSLAQLEGKLALLVLAWNFFDEVARRVERARPKQTTTLLRAFPGLQVQQIGG